MNFCPKETATEAAVGITNPKDGFVYYFCPLVLSQMLAMGRVDFGIGVLDSLFIFSAKNCNPANCASAFAILRNHATSQDYILHFGSHLPTTPNTGTADDPENIFLVKAGRIKR